MEACRQLGDELSKAWHSHGEAPSIPLDEDEALYAQRLIAQRCLYGLDKNQMAADLAKLSLWLATLAKDHPFTFLDHSLRHGDALVGLTRKEIASFHWGPAAQQSFLEDEIRKRIDRATQYRERILNARDNLSYAQLEQELRNADEALDLPRIVGDAVIAAFFAAEKPRLREDTRKRMQGLVETDLRTQGFISVDGEVDHTCKQLRTGSKGITPFHWELEFPEVFATKEASVTGGFDVIVGNPPFAGRNSLVNSNPDAYLDWLKSLHEEAHGNSDLVAHFFRRAFTLLRSFGCFGLIATNTISQGDTRSTGLRWICMNGGTIYRARKRLKWPGQAAVVVSVIHVTKGTVSAPFVLDGRDVPIITAYLFYAGGHSDPAHLATNANKSFEGVKIYGAGFTFDDSAPEGVATPISEMNRFISVNPRNQERVFPYLGGEEVNDSPTHSHRRYVIHFSDWPLRREDLGDCWHDAAPEKRSIWLRDGVVPMDYPAPVAADYPDLLRIVEDLVKPERLAQKDKDGKKFWWRFLRTRPALMGAISGIQQALVISCVTQHIAFARVATNVVLSNRLTVLPFDSWPPFAVLQSRVHETWARFFGSTLEDRFMYAPVDCFETFAFPIDFESSLRLEEIGREYYEYRAAIMQQYQEGLTSVYNSFHDPNSEYPEIPKLRELHDAVDRAVLDAYGWTDVQPTSQFIPEFDDESDEDENGQQQKRKFRYRWPDDIRDDVLARLLELNHQRALEEGQHLGRDLPEASISEAKSKTINNKKSKKNKTTQDAATGLFAIGPGEA